MDNQQGKKAYLYEQDDVSYTPLSTRSGEACGGCRWFNDYVGENAIGGKCQLIQSYPLPIRETGWCSEFDAIPEPKPDYNEVMEELIEVLEAKEHKPNLIERVKALFSLQVKARDEPVVAFKAVGNGKWVATWSNNFEDLEGEYFPARATDAYIARLDAKEVDMPELYYWHIPYSYGKAQTVMRVAADDKPNAPSISIAAGVFYDTPIAKAFEKATAKAKGFKMSHGFMYPSQARVDGVYHYYDTFEISVLPPYAAANPYTLFGEDTMPVVSPDKQKELEALLGKEYAAEVVTKAEQRAKELQEKGVGYKDTPFVDTEARAQLDTLTKEVQSLAETIKAKMPMMEEEDDEDAKKKKSTDEAYRKELNDAIMTLAKSQTAIVQSVKQITDSLELTPRRASKSADTLVPPDDAALKELQDAMAGNKSNEDKVFNAAFGSFLKGMSNGA